MIKKSCLLISAALALVGFASAAQAGPLRAGAAKLSITPTADIFPYQVGREKPIVGVHDDLFTRALVLDDGTRRFVLVSVEVTTIPNPEQVVKAVADAAQVPVGNVMVTATHTHSVPLTFYHGGTILPSQQREMDRIQQNTVKAVRDAVAALQPARIGSARGQAFVNTNNGEQANRADWYDPKGASDKTLDIVRVESASGAPIALMLNYATHGEVMFRSVTKDGGYEVTSDLPGATSRILEGHKGGAPVVLFTSAAEGDQLPLFKSLQPDAQLPGTDQGAAGWALLDMQARRLAASALDTMVGMKPGAADVKISTASSSISCPGQKLTMDRATGKVTSADKPPVVIPLTAVRIGDIALAGVTADIASDMGKAIKAASPVPQTTVVTMLAGAVGYVLTDASYVKPGHGAMGSPVKPGCAQPALSAGISRMLKAMPK